MTPSHAPASTRAAQRALEEAFRVAGALRRRRPLHPIGVVARGVLEVRPGADTGVPLLDTAARLPVLVRLSRAAGLPWPAPDIHGIALRLLDARGGDLLMSTTGSAPVLRHLLRPRRDVMAVYSSIVPYRTARGALMLTVAPAAGGPPRRVPFEADGVRAAMRARPLEFDLRAASPRGRWRVVGRLRLDTPADEEAPGLRFDPVLNAPPGLGSYAVWAGLRLPAYRGARRGFRGERR